MSPQPEPVGSDETIRHILTAYDVWAVVGLSEDPWRAAHSVAEFLQSVGKRVVPVHPTATSVLGQHAYRTLGEIPFPVDVVDVFRRSEAAGAHADEAIAIGAKAVWFQMGVFDDEAYARVTAAGLEMTMGTCPHREWPRLVGVGGAGEPVN